MKSAQKILILHDSATVNELIYFYCNKTLLSSRLQNIIVKISDACLPGKKKGGKEKRELIHLWHCAKGDRTITERKRKMMREKVSKRRMSWQTSPVQETFIKSHFSQRVFCPGVNSGEKWRTTNMSTIAIAFCEATNNRTPDEWWNSSRKTSALIRNDPSGNDRVSRVIIATLFTLKTMLLR